MADSFDTYRKSLDAPADSAAIITPADGADLANATRAILLSAAGTITVDMAGSGTNIALPLQAGINPIRATRIYSTGTDAVTIVGLW